MIQGADDLYFGTAGIPIQAKKKGTVDGIADVRQLGLGAMELEFVHSVNISEEKAPQVKQMAQDHNIFLTCHGQYYINLNAKEEKKLKASQQRIITAATRAYQCGAHYITFHPAFYLRMDKEQVYQTVKETLQAALQDLSDNDIDVWVRPETTGKGSQFGTLSELLQLSQELDGVMPCIDFAHLHARSNGDYNSYEETRSVLEQVENTLGKAALQNMHIHLSGIDYTEKGEKEHLILKDSDLRFQEVLRAWKEFNLKGAVICESPNIEEDALLLQQTYAEL